MNLLSEQDTTTASSSSLDLNLKELPPLSLYVHIPWCVRKCPYCDFNSHQSSGELPEAEYVEALLQDFAVDHQYAQGREISSIFLGGGTPSLFSAASYQRLLSGIQELVTFSKQIEITLEANPGTAERQRFLDYHQIGINRLSLGIQSFDDLQLQKLGRIHDSADGKRAIEFAIAAGFDNFNIDIMYGLPGQKLAAALADLEKALEFSPQHLSWYQLTIEPNTEFFKRPPRLPREKIQLDIQDKGLALLEDRGYFRYEVSAFAQSGRQSRHNLNYWQFGDYIGIGAGAHGKITLPATQSIIRTRKLKQPIQYLQTLRFQGGAKISAVYTAEKLAIARNDLALEFLMNALRLPQGFRHELFAARTGLPFDSIRKQVESLQVKGLVESSADLTRCTPKGLLFLNSVLEEFL